MKNLNRQQYVKKSLYDLLNAETQLHVLKADPPKTERKPYCWVELSTEKLDFYTEEGLPLVPHVANISTTFQVFCHYDIAKDTANEGTLDDERARVQTLIENAIKSGNDQSIAPLETATATYTYLYALPTRPYHANNDDKVSGVLMLEGICLVEQQDAA